MSKMFTCMKMVITGVKNWSPDMIPVAFEWNLMRNLMRYLPGFIDPIYIKFFNNGELTGDTKTQKWS